MEELKQIASQALIYAQNEGLDYAKNAATQFAINVALDKYVVPAVIKSIKINTISNILLVLVIFFNKFIFSSKLLKLYYVLSCASTFYFVNNLINLVDVNASILITLFPYTTSSVKSYLNIVNVLMGIELVGILKEWELDFILYLSIIGYTIYKLGCTKSQQLIQNIWRVINMNKNLQYYGKIWLFENTIVYIVYLLLN